MAKSRAAVLYGLLLTLVLSCTSNSDGPTPGADELSTTTGQITGLEHAAAYLEKANGAAELLGLAYESYLHEVLPKEQPSASELRDIWMGALEILMSYPDMLDELRPPESLSSGHDEYRKAVRNLVADMMRKMRDFETVEEFEGYFLTESLFSAPKLRINHSEAYMSLQGACLVLESGLVKAGVDGAFIVACP